MRTFMRKPLRVATLLILGGTFAVLSGKAQDTPSNPGSLVAADGSGQFTSIQDAINAAPQTSTAASPWTIRVRNGSYHELVYIQREKHFLRLVGEDPMHTTVSFGLYASMPAADGKPIGTFHTPTVWIDADDFAAENMTIENSALRKGQALALRVDGDRDSFRNCRFLGWQDTILANRGRQYFSGCSIRGAVDFIFGGATSFFDRCEIDCAGTGYITAASTPLDQPFGFVFSDCRITGDGEDVHTYLGRPWRAFANVIFLRTQMSGVVLPEGWNNWKAPDRERTSRFVEIGSTGLGARPAARVTWSKKLTDHDAEQVTVAKVLGGADGWNPTATPQGKLP
jgi:pectinesterase